MLPSKLKLARERQLDAALIVSDDGLQEGSSRDNMWAMRIQLAITIVSKEIADTDPACTVDPNPL